MAFLNIFFKTLGLLLGITTFVIILNILVYFISGEKEEFKFTKGNKESENVIAILNLNGPIINNPNLGSIKNFINYIDSTNVKKNLNNIEKYKPDILIIKINSPGGTVPATYSLEKIFEEYKEKNNVDLIFYTSEVLASGGYWIASSGNKIYASYGSIIGSIGVSGPKWYYYNKPISISNGVFGQRIETENGIEIFNQSAGNSKDLYNPFRRPNDKEIIHLQEMVKEIYDDFVSKVSKSRKIEINVLKNEIGALIFTSKQAKENYLLDDVLAFDELISKIAKDKNFIDYKIIEKNLKSNFFMDYFSLFIDKKNQSVCRKLNSNFVSILPIFFNNC